MTDGPLVAKVGSVVKQDPQLRFSKAGKAYTKFSMSHIPWVNGTKGDTQFYEVTAFGTIAENVCLSIHKGDRVAVIGTGQTETWTGKDGQERTSKTILADSVAADLRFATVVISKAEFTLAADTSPF